MTASVRVLLVCFLALGLAACGGGSSGGSGGAMVAPSALSYPSPQIAVVAPGAAVGASPVVHRVIGLPANTRVWPATSHTRVPAGSPITAAASRR